MKIHSRILLLKEFAKYDFQTLGYFFVLHSANFMQKNFEGKKIVNLNRLVILQL